MTNAPHLDKFYISLTECACKGTQGQFDMPGGTTFEVVDIIMARTNAYETMYHCVITKCPNPKYIGWDFEAVDYYLDKYCKEFRPDLQDLANDDQPQYSLDVEPPCHCEYPSEHVDTCEYGNMRKELRKRGKIL